MSINTIDLRREIYIVSSQEEYEMREKYVDDFFQAVDFVDRFLHLTRTGCIFGSGNLAFLPQIRTGFTSTTPGVFALGCFFYKELVLYQKKHI